MNKKIIKEEKKVNKDFKLPRYLRLEKGAMWFDDQGENSSGVRLFSISKKFVGREIKLEEYLNREGEPKYRALATEVPLDEHKNNDFVDYGKVNSDLPWYVDTSTIDPNKLSGILTAYKYGILVAADPNKPPSTFVPKATNDSDFKNDVSGDRIFVGKNKEMFKKLQGLNFSKLKEFILGSPMSEASKKNLIDLYDYEQKGYNPLNRPRLEVLDLIKRKLREFGPGLSSIRRNED
jgi:hypothetical protein